MARTLSRNKSDSSVLLGGFLFAFICLLSIWFFVVPDSIQHVSTLVAKKPSPETVQASNCTNNLPLTVNLRVEHCSDNNISAQGFNLMEEPETHTFYDDRNMTYTIEKPMKNWDEKRVHWLKVHPSFANGVKKRILVVSGSQSGPCKNPMGDRLLLRFFNNKVDYCRIHGYDIFYNTKLLHPKMPTFWAKIPTIRAIMIAHPEVEWIWWIDSDAAFTDMDFKLPLERYNDHNLVVHGWSKAIYEKKSWVGLNAGVFLIRNCQWSMDFMDVWASMGPQTPDFEKWGERQRTMFKDKIDDPNSDDQSGLIYLLLTEEEKWGNKVYIESEYYFEGYWLEIVGKLDKISEKYNEMERRYGNLGRRHAEKVSEHYAELREPHLKGVGFGIESWRRPFITHFAGCQPCSGNHNPIYTGESCWEGMTKVLNFADDQVLRNFGFMHRDLQDSSTVLPVPFRSTY